MDETGGVRATEPRARLLPDLEHALRCEPSFAAQSVAERFARDVLHDDERPAALLADVEHLDDVRVAEPGGDPPLPREAGAKPVVAGDWSARNLIATGRPSSVS